MRFIALLVFLTLMGCVRRPVDLHGINTITTGELDEIYMLAGKSVKSKKDKEALGAIRKEAVRDMALSLGARAGLAWRAKQINALLEPKLKQLDRLFNFTPLVLKHHVLPPVLIEGSNTLNQENPNSIRLADKTYKILQQAQFITTPPTWRNYLWLEYAMPETPDNSLLPRNKLERAVWQRNIVIGWHQGIEQANNIYNDNLARLKRDYNGMLLYRKLLALNIVSPPFVAKASLGITGGGPEMRINDQVLRITAHPSLDPNSHHWKPALAHE